MPVDWEEDRCIAEDAEIERIVRVLPNVVTADHNILAERLLQSSMELIPEAGLKRSLASLAAQQGRQHHIRASLAREHQVFVKWRFKRSCIRDAQNRVGFLNAVCRAHA